MNILLFREICDNLIVHHKDAKDSKTRQESSLKDTTFANLGVLCAFAVHKRLYRERLRDHIAENDPNGQCTALRRQASNS